ncbi:MAG: hypothetical protein BGO78_09770 [Chloroflexi bacterium 44-23]|nr:MAG: hypothetical protein BGO78_09770 [Chloroflexi bacterium 44-23]
MDTDSTNNLNYELFSQAETDLSVNFEKLEREDIGLRFHMNEETRQVMVYVINRATQKVIRAIPQEKLINLQASDLLNLLAK